MTPYRCCCDACDFLRASGASVPAYARRGIDAHAWWQHAIRFDFGCSYDIQMFARALGFDDQGHAALFCYLRAMGALG